MSVAALCRSEKGSTTAAHLHTLQASSCCWSCRRSCSSKVCSSSSRTLSPPSAGSHKGGKENHQSGTGRQGLGSHCASLHHLPATPDSTQQLGSSQLIDESRSPPLIVACVQVTAKVRLPSWWAMRRGCSPRGTVRMCSFYTQQSTDTQQRQQDLVNHRVEADEPPIEVTSGSSS